MNNIDLTKSQIKAYENGATIVMIPLSIPAGYEYQGLSAKDDNIWRANFWNGENILFVDLPFQKDDKDIFVKEEFWEHETRNVFYKAENENIRNDKYWLSASEMTKEQSRYLFSECTDIKIKKVQDIKLKEWQELGTCLFDSKKFYNQQMQEQKIAKTYDDNEYVFLVQFKKVTKWKN